MNHDVLCQQEELVILTGVSGAGKSSALKYLEDLGYEAIDNLPLRLLSAVAGMPSGTEHRLVVGIDVRSRDFSVKKLLNFIEKQRKQAPYPVKVVFLDCEDSVLQNRYTETRRKHPLAVDRPVEDGIRLERELLEEVKATADWVLDTSRFSVHDLKRHIHTAFSDVGANLKVFVSSFSFKEGVPRDADMVIDVRFLANPHWNEQLRPLTGKDAPVQEFIAQDRDFAAFYHNLIQLLAPLLPRYKEEGKSYLTLAFGCTGGKHRSVFCAEKAAGDLAEMGYNVSVRHRDLERHLAKITKGI